MISHSIQVLLVETSGEITRLLKDALLMGQLRAAVTLASSPEDGLQRLSDNAYDVLLFSDQFGVDPLVDFNRLRPDLPVVVLTRGQSALSFLKPPLPVVQGLLSTESAGILSAARKIQLAIHRKLTEKQLSKAQDNIDRLANLSGEALFTLDPAGKILFVNEATETMVGHCGSDMLGTSITGWFDEITAQGIFTRLSRAAVRDRTGFSPFQKGLLATSKGENTEIEFALGCWHIDAPQACCLIVRDLTARRTLETQLKSTLCVQRAVAHLNTLREQNLPLADKLNHVLGALRDIPYLVKNPQTDIGLVIKDDRQNLISPEDSEVISEKDKQCLFAFQRQEFHGVYYFHDKQHNRYGFALKAAGSEPLGFLILNEKPQWLHTAELSSQFRLLLCTIALMINEHLSQGKISRLSTAIEQSPAGVVITDSDGNIQYVNEAVSVMTGYRKSEMLGNNPRILKSGLMADEIYSDLWTTIVQGKIWKGEIRNRRKDGIVYWESMLIAPVESPNEGRFNYIAIKENIDQRKQDEQQLQRLATHDTLTGLPNRALLHDRLEQGLVNARRYRDGLTLLLIDLDDFSMINNQHGHQAGDELLKIIASRLIQGRRGSDTIGRQSGDEFVIILPRLFSPAAIQPIIDSITARLSKPCRFWDTQLVVSCSIGVATCLDGNVSGSDLYRRADMAMYEAKKVKGHSSQFFNENIGIQIDRKIWFRHAIKEAPGNGELALHYQPQINMETGALSGAEALLRWVHPEKGTISPAEFIPLAEECGSIVSLGDWVIENVCQQLGQWLKAGYHPPRIAINLAAKQLLADGLLSAFLRGFKKNTVPAKLLEVELTESEIMQYPEQSAGLLKSLRQLGISVAVDDFGTGYSSLSYLKRLPLDTLKIDRSFISDIANDNDSQTIAATIINLGHNLGLKVLAEGVESKEQLSLLRDLGADEYQGFYCSPAIPANQFIKYLPAPPLLKG